MSSSFFSYRCCRDGNTGTHARGAPPASEVSSAPVGTYKKALLYHIQVQTYPTAWFIFFRGSAVVWVSLTVSKKGQFVFLLSTHRVIDGRSDNRKRGQAKKGTARTAGSGARVQFASVHLSSVRLFVVSVFIPYILYLVFGCRPFFSGDDAEDFFFVVLWCVFLRVVRVTAVRLKKDVFFLFWYFLCSYSY